MALMPWVAGEDIPPGDLVFLALGEARRECSALLQTLSSSGEDWRSFSLDLCYACRHRLPRRLHSSVL